jgi:hypothetical protein
MTIKDWLMIGALVISVPAIYSLRKVYIDVFDSPPKDEKEAAKLAAAQKAANKNAVMNAMSKHD